jgi:maleate isomerase
MSHALLETLDPAPGAAAEEPVRFGMIALSTDLTSERDAARVLDPQTAALHVARVAFENPTTPENLARMAPRLAQAAALLVPGEPLAAICYSCTAASVVIGDDAVARAIGLGRPGVPVVTPAAAACRALRTLRARRIALLTPYLSETTAPVIRYLEAAGFEVVRAVCMGLADDRDIARVGPAAIVAATRRADAAEADAIFISCTALPVLGHIERIEAALGKAVVSSNQASLREMLLAGGQPLPRGFGRLFDVDAPASAPA